MPVLGPAKRGASIPLMFVEAEDLPAAQQSLGFFAGMDQQASLAPWVTFAKQVAGEKTALIESVLNALPQAREGRRGAEGQGETGVNQLGGGQVKVVEARLHGVQSWAIGNADLRLESGQGPRFHINCLHSPATPQQLKAVTAGAAAQVQRQSRLSRPVLQRLQQARMGGGAPGLLVEIMLFHGWVLRVDVCARIVHKSIVAESMKVRGAPRAKVVGTDVYWLGLDLTGSRAVELRSATQCEINFSLASSSESRKVRMGVLP